MGSQAAYEAFTAEEHNRVVQVTGNLLALVDNAVELVRVAATLTGLRPAGRRLSTNADIEALRAGGALSGEQTYNLVQLKELCDRLRHACLRRRRRRAHGGALHAEASTDLHRLLCPMAG